jgi:hypothetical protein
MLRSRLQNGIRYPWSCPHLFVLLKSLNASLEKLKSLLRATGTSYLKFLAALFVVRNEELFELRQHCLANVVNRFEVFMIVGMNRDAEQAVVGFGFSVFRLLGCDNPDDANLDQASDMRWCIHEDEDVERIAIFAER